MSARQCDDDGRFGDRLPFGEVNENTNRTISERSSLLLRDTNKEVRIAQTSQSSSVYASFEGNICNGSNISLCIPHSESITMSSSRPSSVASSGSYSGLASPTTSLQSNASHRNNSLQPPTLGSALGINPSSTSSSSSASASASTSASSSTTIYPAIPRKVNRSSGKQSSHGNSAPPPVWARRPSLPTMPSMGNRMSVASVASFESLPEGEPVPHFAISPLGKSVQDHRGSDESVTGARDSATASSSTSTNSPSPLKSSISFSNLPQKDAEVDSKKRKHLAMELLSTEHIFVASLRLINDFYYQPLAALSRGVPSNKVESLGTAAPVLSRKAVNEIFSNFVDILHLNLELLSRLDNRLSGRSRETPSSRPSSMATSPSESSKEADQVKPWDADTDSIGDLLVPMAPFLKMYSLYVKNFSSALTRIESERKANDSFARFLKETEKATWGRASNQGGFGFGLGFQAHLLTIVQRIPRYKLLVGDLVRCTPTSHKDYPDLCKAYEVIEQVAESINDNIRQHEMILVMLGLQRSLIGLTEPLIVPGRSLIKRGTLLKACRKNIQSREFFLFTDCLAYAAPINGSIDAASAAWQAFSRYGSNEPPMASPISPTSPTFPERSSYSAAADVKSSQHGFDGARARIRTMSGPSPYESKRMSMSLEGQQLQFRGKFNLQDCTVVAVDDVVSPEPWLRHCLEIRTPGKSFAVYAETFEVKVQWLSAIRNAREEWVSNRRTLHAEEDSIQAKRDRRRSLQAGAIATPPASRKSSIAVDVGNSVAPIPENEESMRPSSMCSPPLSSTTITTNYFGDACNKAINGTSSSSKPKSHLKVLDEYNAPVWVPDSRADRCACCSEQFGIWRRKHHCRLCGQVVCWACSSKTFLIAGYEDGEEDRPARSCDTCYESVFPDSPESSPHFAQFQVAAGEGDNSSNRRPDSEVSLNTPPTPTSPPTSPPMNNLGMHFIGDGVALDSEDALSPLSPPIVSATSITNSSSGYGNAPTSHPRHRPFHRGMGGGGIKWPKGKLSEVQVFQHNGSLLSPQVQAATSGLGTFRLVTPRLTTPEGEDCSTTQSPIVGAGGGGGDYFAGVEPGQSELRESRPRPRLLSGRKKPMSAAARLSSFYGGLNSPSMTNLSRS